MFAVILSLFSIMGYSKAILAPEQAFKQTSTNTRIKLPSIKQGLLKVYQITKEKSKNIFFDFKNKYFKKIKEFFYSKKSYLKGVFNKLRDSVGFLKDIFK